MDLPPHEPPDDASSSSDRLPKMAGMSSRTAMWSVAVFGIVVLGLGFALLGPFGGSDRAPRPAAGDQVTLPPPPSSAAPSSSAPPQPRTVGITGVGDVIMGATPDLPPDGGATFFDPVAAQLAGDVVVGNLEGPLTEQTVTTKCGPDSDRCFAFRTPPSYARWLSEAGFTVMNLANNHSRDFGTAGLTDTGAALDQHGIKHTGLPGEISVSEVNGVKVAVVGFAPYSWAQSLLDIPGAQALVRQAATQADLVVVAMHAGAEGADQTHVRPGTEIFLEENRGDPIAFAHAVVDAGATMVVGHGPHVLRGMEWYKGRLIAYSMGNFAGYRTLSTAGVLGLGGILKVELRPDGTWAGGRMVASHMVGQGTPALDPSGQAIQLVGTLSQEDFGACGVRMGPDGQIAAPTC